MKALFLDMHREGRSPSQRFRYEQYLDYLEENGIEWEHSYLLSKEDDKVFYQKGNYFKKFIILLKAIRRRFHDLKRAPKVDLIFIQREAFMLGTTFFERRLAKTKAKLVFDFDDAIWLAQVSKSSAPNKRLSWLKNSDKTKEIIGLSDLVLAGNHYLAEYASRFNDNVTIIPTTINTDLYRGKSEEDYDKETICIGWSGSKTTIDHFEEAIPALKEIKEKYPNKVTFKVIGDENYHNEVLGITGEPWKKETEIEDLKKIDIGIMPLPDDEWAKGKCGLKGLQYMALGIPTVMSPVGVNKDIIEDGRNGFLPESEGDWVLAISKLVDCKEKRIEVGKNGREKVVNKYSTCSQRDRFLSVLLEL